MSLINQLKNKKVRAAFKYIFTLEKILLFLGIPFIIYFIITNLIGIYLIYRGELVTMIILFISFLAFIIYAIKFGSNNEEY